MATGRSGWKDRPPVDVELQPEDAILSGRHYVIPKALLRLSPVATEAASKAGPMNDKTQVQPAAADEESFFDQLQMMRKAFMASPARNMILLFSAGVFAVILATAVGQIILNRWYKPFYDAIERR